MDLEVEVVNENIIDVSVHMGPPGLDGESGGLKSYTITPGQPGELFPLPSVANVIYFTPPNTTYEPPSYFDGDEPNCLAAGFLYDTNTDVCSANGSVTQWPSNLADQTCRLPLNAEDDDSYYYVNRSTTADARLILDGNATLLFSVPPSSGILVQKVSGVWRLVLRTGGGSGGGGVTDGLKGDILVSVGGTVYRLQSFVDVSGQSLHLEKTITHTGGTYAPSGNTQTIDLADDQFPFLTLNQGAGGSTLTLTLEPPPGRSQGILFIRQHATNVRNLAFASTGASVAAIDQMRTWTADPPNAYIAVPWTFDGTTIGLATGGGTATIAQTSTVYVSKAGNNANSGTSESKPKLTIASAITAAAALVTGGATHTTIVVQDAGTYTENLTLAANTTLDASAAVLVGSLSLTTGCNVSLKRHYASAGSQNCVTLAAGATVQAFYKTGILDTRGLSGSLTSNVGLYNTSTTGGVLFADVGVLYVGQDSRGILSDISGDGHTHVRIPDLYLAGNNAVGIYSSDNTTNIIGYIDHILEIGSVTGTYGIQSLTALAKIRITAIEIIADTAYEITGNELWLLAARIVGTKSGSPAFDSTIGIPTNLTSNPNNSNVVVESSTGNDATIAPVDNTVCGVMTPAMLSKLNGTLQVLNPTAPETGLVGIGFYISQWNDGSNDWDVGGCLIQAGEASTTRTLNQIFIDGDQGTYFASGAATLGVLDEDYVIGDTTLFRSKLGLGAMATQETASKAQAQAGSSNTVGMTPLRTYEAIDAFNEGPAFTYNGNGTLATITYDDGAVRTLTYNSDGTLATSVHVRSGFPTITRTFVYSSGVLTAVNRTES